MTNCQFYVRDHYCGEPDTRRFINGHYCRIHTPGVISGLPPMTPELWEEGRETWAAMLAQRAVDGRTRQPRARARVADPVTSHVAAGSVRGITATHRRVLTLLEMHGPMTDEEIAARWDAEARGMGWPLVSPSGLRTRRAELVDAGLIRDTGETRLTKARRHTTVWALSNRYATRVDTSTRV